MVSGCDGEKMILTDPFELIKTYPSGSALYGRTGETTDTLETCILIREDEPQIRKISANPIVELRSGLWEGKGAIIIAVMVKSAGLLYETWWNYHRDDGGDKYFDDMIRQSMIPILVYDNHTQRRSILVRNSLAPSFKKYKGKILAATPWAMAEFDNERERIYARYPNVTALWEALGANLS